MSLLDKPFVGQGKANYCIIVSIFGIGFLAIIGALIQVKDPVITGGKEPIKEKDLAAAATSCFIAAGLYGFFLILCSWQSWLNSKISQQQVEEEEELDVNGVS